MQVTKRSMLNAQDDKGKTALHIAVKRERLRSFRELRDIDPTIVNTLHETVLHPAAWTDNAAVLKELLAVFKTCLKQKLDHSKCGQQHPFIDMPNDNGQSALHICALRGHDEGLSALIDHGADFLAADCVGGDAGNTVSHLLV